MGKAFSSYNFVLSGVFLLGAVAKLTVSPLRQGRKYTLRSRDFLLAREEMGTERSTDLTFPRGTNEAMVNSRKAQISLLGIIRPEELKER